VKLERMDKEIMGVYNHSWYASLSALDAFVLDYISAIVLDRSRTVSNKAEGRNMNKDKE